MTAIGSFDGATSSPSQSLIYIWDLDASRLVYASQDVNSFMGSAAESGEFSPWFPPAHPGKFAIASENTSGDIEYELQVPIGQGLTRWLSYHESVFTRDLTGRPTQIIGAIKDITERKRLKDRLRASEERLALAMEATADGVWDWDLATGRLTVNRQWLAMLGFTEEEFTGHISFWEPLCHPDDLPEAQRRLQALFDGVCPSYEYEHRLRHRDGSWVWVLGRAKVPQRDAKGAALRVVGTNVNVTARKEAEAARDRAEERLRDSEARLRQTVESVHLGLWEWDLPSGRVQVDSAWCAISGYNPEDAPGNLEDWEKTVHPDDLARVEDLLNAHLADPHNIFEADYRAIVRPGEIVWVMTRGSVVEWEPDGTPRRMIGTLQDISDRKAQEQVIRDTQARFQSAIDAMHDGLVVHNRRGEIVVCNRRAEEILGLSFSQLSGLTSMDPRWRAVHPDGTDWSGETHPSVVALREGRSQWNALMGVHRPDGSLVWVNVNAEPLFRDGEETPHSAVITFADITESRRLQEEQRRLMAEAVDRADRDPLTNLLNHRTFYARLYKAAEQVSGAGQANGTPLTLCIALLDLDNFKFFNDTYGHLTGDEVLCHVADALRDACGEGAEVARIGGDEFAAFILHSDSVEVEEWSRRLSRAAHTLTFQPPDDLASVPLRLSVGIGLFPDESSDVGQVLRLADGRAAWDKRSAGADEVVHRQAEHLRSSMGDGTDGFSLLDALVLAVDVKDRYTRRHSEDVFRFASLIAEGMGLPESEKASLQVAALIHDVGKIAVPDKLLRRPGPLTGHEFDAVRQHSVLGGLLVSAIPELSHTLDAVRYHHERWDGTGYPSGLAGEAIPLPARILAVADAYSAMTTDRPYRKCLSPDEAARLLRQGAGIHWDACCVAALLGALERDGKSEPPSPEADATLESKL